MKTLSIVFLFLSQLCFSQTNRFIKFPWAKMQNIIFSSNYSPPFLIKDFECSITPSNEQIQMAEKIFLKQYNLSRINFVNNYNISHNERINSPKIIPYPRKAFKEYLRQYIGYVNERKDTIIVIGLFNFKNKRKIKEYFPNWQNEFIVGFGDFYEKPCNVDYFSVNLTKKILCNEIVFGTNCYKKIKK